MTFFAGNTLTAAELNNIIRPGWTTYGSDTTTLTAATTNPTKGNSTYTARYRYPSGSDMCDIEMAFVIGSTFAAGSGAYRFLLPVAADTAGLTIAHAWIEEAGVAIRAGIGTYVDSTHFQMFYDGGGGVIGSGGLSSSWTTNDQLRISLRYAVAV